MSPLDLVSATSQSPSGNINSMEQQFEEFLQQEVANADFAAYHHQDDLDGQSIRADDQTVVPEVTMQSNSLFRGPLYQTPMELEHTDLDVSDLFNRNRATESDTQARRTTLLKSLPALTENEAKDFKGLVTKRERNAARLSEKHLKDDLTSISLKTNAFDPTQDSSSTNRSGSIGRRSLEDFMPGCIKVKGKNTTQPSIADHEHS